MREYLVLREAWVRAESPQQAAEAALEDLKCDPYARCVVIDPKATHCEAVLAVLGGLGADVVHVAQ